MICRSRSRPDLLVAEDVVEGVVERAEVGVHLLGEVARQEAELLARLDRGAAEDDPLDLLLEERGGGHRHGEVGLPRAGRADREDDVVLADRLQVLLLPHVARRDDLPERGADGAVLEEVDERGRRVFLDDPDRARDVDLLRDVAPGDELRELGEEVGRPLGSLGAAAQRDHAAARRDLHAEGVLEEPQVFVVDTEERAEPGFGKVQGNRSVLNSAVSSPKG